MCCDVSAHLVRKNQNGDAMHIMNAVTFTSNGTQTGRYINGDGIKGKRYYLAARVVDLSRFDSTDITYTFEP